MASWNSDRFATPLAIALVCVLFVYGVTNVKDGHNWGGDFSLYISHAINIVDGRNYADTGYIFSPGDILSSPFYPPGTPIILTIPYSLFGFEMVSFKITMVAIYTIALLVIYFNFSIADNSRTIGLIVLAMAGLNEYLLNISQNIVSDIIFLLFCYSHFLLVEFRNRSQGDSRTVVLSILAGLAAYAAIATREIGIALVLATIVSDVLTRRRIWTNLAPLLLVFLAGWALQILALGSATSHDYRTLLRELLNFFEHVWPYGPALAHFFPVWFAQDHYGSAAHVAIVTVICTLAAVGFTVQFAKRTVPMKNATLLRLGISLLRKLTLYDLFALIYLLILFIWPFSGVARYLIPIFPIFIYYMVKGVIHLIESKRNWVNVAGKIPGGGIALFVVSTVIILRVELPEQGIHHPNSQELFAAVRGSLPDTAVIIFRKPRVLALYGQRHSARWPKGASACGAWRRFASIRATHLVLASPETGLDYPEYLTYGQYHGEHPGNLIFRNDHFEIYDISEAVTRSRTEDIKCRPV